MPVCKLGEYIRVTTILKTISMPISTEGACGQHRKPCFSKPSRKGKTSQGAGLAAVSAYEVVWCRARQTEIKTEICNHTFRATGITAYLKGGGSLETAAQMAAHGSTKTTQLYDRCSDKIILDEVERVHIGSIPAGGVGGLTVIFSRA